MKGRWSLNLRRHAILLSFSFVLGLIALPSFAEEAAAPTITDQAKGALAKQESDKDRQDLIQETLTRADQEYSLQKQGKIKFIYDFTYSYYGNAVATQTAVSGTGNQTLVSIIQDSQHTYEHALTADYGLLDNLTASLRFPLVYKYDDINENQRTNVGDVRGELRWQPWHNQKHSSQITFLSGATIPTGSSPYEIDLGEELATGQGFYSVYGGANIYRVIDPVVAFGSLNLAYNLGVDGLSQPRFIEEGLASTLCQQSPSNPLCNPNSPVCQLFPQLCQLGFADTVVNLTEIKPGQSVGFGMGLAYSLSYDVNLTVQYQQTYMTKTEFILDNGQTLSSAPQTIGIIVFGSGWRLKEDRILNVNIGLGQTTNAPDIYLSASLPFSP